MLEHNSFYVSEGIDFNKTDGSYECTVCHYCTFLK